MYSQGDIVVIPFPFTDFSSYKKRPAIVISNTSFNTHKNVMVVAISTQSGISSFSEPLSRTDITSGNLQKQSYVRLQNIVTIEKDIILQCVGHITDSFLKKITSRIAGYVSLQ